MAGRRKFERIVTPIGVAVYPHLTRPDTKFNPQGEYKTKLRVAFDDARELIERLEKIRDEAYAQLDPVKRKKLKLAPVCETELDEEGEETGFVIFAAKMKAKVIPADGGKPWEQRPKLWDAKNNELNPEDINIWGGSKIRLSCEVVPFEMQQAKQFGVTLRLKQVQIIELVEGGGSESPFSTTDGYTKGSTSDEPDEDDDGSADF